MDTALARRTPLAGRVSLDFRFEVFNLFNTAQYGQPASNLANLADFGRILTPLSVDALGTGLPRRLQFMMRLSF